jgi:hypothetical protein
MDMLDDIRKIVRLPMSLELKSIALYQIKQRAKEDLDAFNCSVVLGVIDGVKKQILNKEIA